MGHRFETILGAGSYRVEAPMRVVHVLRKPLSEGTVAANTLKHGCGGLNIDGCRVAYRSEADMTPSVGKGSQGELNPGCGPNLPGYKENWGEWKVEPSGRWPANMILQHLDGCECRGTRKVKGHTGYPNGPGGKSDPMHGWGGKRSAEVRPDPWAGHADEEGNETVADWHCVEGCPVVALDKQSGVVKGTVRQPTGKPVYPTEGTAMNWNPNSVRDNTVRGFGDTGGASRYFKQIGGSKEGG